MANRAPRFGEILTDIQETELLIARFRARRTHTREEVEQYAKILRHDIHTCRKLLKLINRYPLLIWVVKPLKASLDAAEKEAKVMRGGLE